MASTWKDRKCHRRYSYRLPNVDVTDSAIYMRRDGPKTYAIVCTNSEYDRDAVDVASDDKMDTIAIGPHGISSTERHPQIYVQMYADLFGRHRIDTLDLEDEDDPAFNVTDWRTNTDNRRLCPKTPTERVQYHIPTAGLSNGAWPVDLRRNEQNGHRRTPVGWTYTLNTCVTYLYFNYTHPSSSQDTRTECDRYTPVTQIASASFQLDDVRYIEA